MENEKSTHTSGVWKLWGTSIYVDQDGTSNIDTAVFVADVPQEVDGKVRTFNAERICDCVNALSDIPNPKECLEQQKQALEDMAGFLKTISHDYNQAGETVKKINALLTKHNL